MECPRCGQVGEYPVIKTNPDVLKRANKTQLFERIAGKDISYRRRHKRCSNCKQNFETLEMPDIFFDSLLNEIERLESQNKFLKQAIIDAGNYLLKQAEEV
jgi:transcriptional regulator NrdR family protein